MGNSPEVFKQPHVWEAEGSSRIPFGRIPMKPFIKKNSIVFFTKRIGVI